MLPLSLFGDEGRDPKRGNFLIWSVESPIGLWDLPGDWDCECPKELSKLPPPSVMNFADDRAAQDSLYHRATKQCTNMQSHSYVTRHLLWGLPRWKYKSQREVLEKHIELLSEDIMHIFTGGHEASCFFGFGKILSQTSGWNDAQSMSSRGWTRFFWVSRGWSTLGIYNVCDTPMEPGANDLQNPLRPNYRWESFCLGRLSPSKAGVGQGPGWKYGCASCKDGVLWWIWDQTLMSLFVTLYLQVLRTTSFVLLLDVVGVFSILVPGALGQRWPPSNQKASRKTEPWPWPFLSLVCSAFCFSWTEIL